MQSLIVKRKSSLNFRTGRVHIFIGDKRVSSIDDNTNAIQVMVKEGDYVWAKMQWCSSNKVEIKSGVKELTITTFLSNRSFLIILFATLATTLTSLLTTYVYFGLFPILLALFPLYYITFGRKKYLKLYVSK